MPCDCSHMLPHEKEKEMSKICCLLEHVIEGKPIDQREYAGYHPFAYGRAWGFTPGLDDRLIARLCLEFRHHPDVTKLALEAQIWWRDHQAVDAAREAAEKKGDLT